MKNLITVTILILCLASCGNVTVMNNEPYNPKTNTTRKPDIGPFAARELQTAEGLLPYRIAHFNPDGLETKPALVLYMHSANGRGNDNTTQLAQQKGGGFDSELPHYTTLTRADVSPTMSIQPFLGR